MDLPSSRTLVACALALLVGCGGKAVIDGWGGPGQGGDGAGHGTSGTGNSGAATTTTGSGGAGGSVLPPCENGNPSEACAALFAAFYAAFQEAVSCQLCPWASISDHGCDYDVCPGHPDIEPCVGGLLIHDRCGCLMGSNATKPDSVAAAVAAYEQWTAAGCGPCQCGAPCPILLPGPGKCDWWSYPACVGSCAPPH